MGKKKINAKDILKNVEEMANCVPIKPITAERIIYQVYISIIAKYLKTPEAQN